jgi:hypothetical protein
MASYCKSQKVDLSPISAFSDVSDEWPLAMLSIYESLYQADCQKLDKIMALKGINQKVKGVPDSVICYSTAIKPFLMFLNDYRGNSDIEHKLE